MTSFRHFFVSQYQIFSKRNHVAFHKVSGNDNFYASERNFRSFQIKFVVSQYRKTL